jgi:hypothetical protein
MLSQPSYECFSVFAYDNYFHLSLISENKPEAYLSGAVWGFTLSVGTQYYTQTVKKKCLRNANTLAYFCCRLSRVYIGDV